MKKLFFLLLGGVLLLGIAFWLISWFSAERLFHRVDFDSRIYTLEVARTDEARIVGLGGRVSLCESCAMLFLFEKPASQAFWMKDMRFPLDIVWLLDDTVVHVERAVPWESEAVYYPEVLANRVLEFNAGEASTLEVGEQVEFLR